MKKGIWMGKKKGRKAPSKSVRTRGHCMKQQCHHYNWILEFISIFLMYSLFKSSHSITTFHCNFCSPFEERRAEHRKENWQARQVKCGERKGLCMHHTVKDAEGKKRTGLKPKRRELRWRDKQGLNQVIQFRSSSVRFSLMGNGELFPLVTSASNLLLYYFAKFLSMFPAQLGKASAIHEQRPSLVFLPLGTP